MIEKLQEIRKINEKLDEELELLKEEIARKQRAYKEQIAGVAEQIQIARGINEEEFESFVKEPYAIIPGKKDEWFVAVPKFIRMNLGWLDHTTEAYNIFRINKYMRWLGDIPREIEKQFKFEEKLPLKIFDGVLLTGKENQARAWNKYNKFLTRRQGNDKISVKRGYEFKLMAQLIDDGILPFVPHPVEKEDMRDKVYVNFDLRPYQKEAWEKFKKLGAMGVFWAYSAGKTFLGLYIGAVLKGDKFVVAPSHTLVEQWEQRIEQYTPETKDEWTVLTYHSFDKLKGPRKDEEYRYILGIFDECHHLPANTFSRFATASMKYRLGLSATPYREDGRTNYIFALTHHAHGLSWEHLIEIGVLELPDVRVYIVPTWKQKEEKLKEILATQKKTIIFCDTISIGNRLSKALEAPFVYGATRNRIEIVKESDLCIISRVGDEGLSIPEVERIIEIDFLGNSRRQEGQRYGRALHGDAEYSILMTDKEFDECSRRLYSLYEKGTKIEVIR